MILISLATGCVLGICIIYSAAITAITSKLNMYSHLRDVQKLQYMRLVWKSSSHNNAHAKEATGDTVQSTSFSLNITPSQFLIDQQFGDLSENVNTLSADVTRTTRTLLITAVNKSSTALTPEAISTTTTMTFNTTLFVHCKESPYIECLPPNVKPIPGKIFQIAYLRRPKWLPKSEIDVTRCKINQCVIDHKTVTNDTDIVVIYGVGLKDNFRVPQRWQHQLYAMQVWEPPGHTHSDFITNEQSPWNHQINLLMSYRVDADLFAPYSRLRFNPKPLAKRPNYYEIAKNKTRTAVWICSHCNTQSRREKYVKEMQKYVDVDIFGRCGNRCSTSDSTCNDWDSKYKFYLSFENSLCTDYVTEKFFKLFDPNIFVIPVVRGGADYDKHFPNFTYINSAHFKTPKDLAFHLKHLASDLQKYSKYLEYNDLYQTVPYENVACKMCAYVHTTKLPPKTQTYNLKSMLGKRQCHNPTDL